MCIASAVVDASGCGVMSLCMWIFVRQATSQKWRRWFTREEILGKLGLEAELVLLPVAWLAVHMIASIKVRPPAADTCLALRDQ